MDHLEARCLTGRMPMPMPIGRKAWRWCLLVAASTLLCLNAAAHELIAQCAAVDAKTIRCRGGHGDGSGTPGATLAVIGLDERMLVAGKLDARSTVTFSRPAVDFYVLLDVGPGHQVVIEQDEIDMPKKAARP